LKPRRPELGLDFFVLRRVRLAWIERRIKLFLLGRSRSSAIRSSPGGPQRARWALALGWDCAQGEALGLMWSDLDLDEGVYGSAEGGKRPRYDHGCDPPCGRKHPLLPGQTQTSGHHGGDEVARRRRGIGPPDALVGLLRKHASSRSRTDGRRSTLARRGVAVREPDRCAVNMNTDHHDWKRLLKEAGLREADCTTRGTPRRPCSCFSGLGTSRDGDHGLVTLAMAARYQHITAPSDVTSSNRSTACSGRIANGE